MRSDEAESVRGVSVSGRGILLTQSGLNPEPLTPNPRVSLGAAQAFKGLGVGIGRLGSTDGSGRRFRVYLG